MEAPILDRVGTDQIIIRRSPLEADAYAEYRDGEFLDLLGLSHLREPLADFWPERGPQGDALGQFDSGGVRLVEAKAHIGEIFFSRRDC